MDLGPRFDQASLGRRQAAAQTLNGVDCKDGGLILIVGVEVRPMVLATGFYEHSNNDAEKSRQFRHVMNLTTFVGADVRLALPVQARQAQFSARRLLPVTCSPRVLDVEP
jgi:hypothetical protein